MPIPTQQPEAAKPEATATAVAVAQPAPQPGILAQLRTAVVMGGGFIGGGGIIFGAFELLRAEPEKGFDLLKAWGPQFIVMLFVVWALNGGFLKVLALAEKFTDRFIGSLDAIGLEQKRQADAAEARAAKDDREQERIATLVEYSAARSREALEVVSRVAAGMDKISAQMDRIESQQSKPGQ